MSNDQPELFELTDDEATLLEQVIDPEVRHKWPESLASMMDIVAAAFRSDGMPAPQATKLAGKAMHALAIYHGGRVFYLPRNSEGECAIRDRQMFQLWMQGLATPRDLAERYHISHVQALKIIARQRGLWRQKYAPELPGFEMLR